MADDDERTGLNRGGTRAGPTTTTAAVIAAGGPHGNDPTLAPAVPAAMAETEDGNNAKRREPTTIIRADNATDDATARASSATKMPTPPPSVSGPATNATRSRLGSVFGSSSSHDAGSQVAASSNNATATATRGDGDSKLGVAGIAAIVGGCLVLMGLAFVIIYVRRRRRARAGGRRRGDEAASGDGRYVESSATPGGRRKAKKTSSASAAAAAAARELSRAKSTDSASDKFAVPQKIRSQPLSKLYQPSPPLPPLPNGGRRGPVATPIRDSDATPSFAADASQRSIAGVMLSYRSKVPFQDTGRRVSLLSQRTENYEFSIDTNDNVNATLVVQEPLSHRQHTPMLESPSTDVAVLYRKST